MSYTLLTSDDNLYAILSTDGGIAFFFRIWGWGRVFRTNTSIRKVL